MADEFVEVVNTTLTSTELPNETTEYTLKTAGAAESFAIKDIGIENTSSIASYQFLINDFKSVSFGSGESGVASGLDLIPESGTLKIKGTNIPIDSSSVLFTRGNGSLGSKILTETNITEVSRSDTSLSSIIDNGYSDTDTFFASTSAQDSSNTYANGYWRNGTKFRKIRRRKTNFDLIRYADSEGTSTSTISTYRSLDYDATNEKIYGLDSGILYEADATANISFSSTGADASGFTTAWSSDPEIHVLKGLVFAIRTPAINPEVYVFNPSTGVALYFSGSKQPSPGSVSSGQNGYAFNYDPTNDQIILFHSTYNTSNPHYIGKHVCPKTLTEINAYTSNTTISDNWSGGTQTYTRGSATSGPFAYNYAHFMRGSSTNPNIFYLSDGSQVTSNDNVTAYYYDWNSNTLNTVTTMDHLNSEESHFFIFERDINTADQTFLGGSSPDSLKVRVTGIKTT